MPILNLAGYKFVPLDDLAALKEALEVEGRALQIKGTILLAHEGINLFLAGEQAEVGAFMEGLRRDPRFADLTVRESWSDQAPFRRFRVRLKKEIITLKRPALRPGRQRAPAVDAVTLKRWLDQGCDDAGRQLLLLDTRNRYEVEKGTFRGALDPGIRHFSHFPDAVAQLPAEARDQTVVTFCTGGIRCEKAALFLRVEGFAHAVQLDGGILKYFEEVGGAHYEGACFVFDERECLDAALTPAVDSTNDAAAAAIG